MLMLVLTILTGGKIETNNTFDQRSVILGKNIIVGGSLERKPLAKRCSYEVTY